MLIRQGRQRRVLFVNISVFKTKEFRFQLSVCKGCHNVLLISIDEYCYLNLHGADYRCIIFGIRKNEAICILTNSDFSGESGSLQV